MLPPLLRRLLPVAASAPGVAAAGSRPAHGLLRHHLQIVEAVPGRGL